MNPNPDNVGTLEACQRLQAAGIVLETEAVWRFPKQGKPFLTNAEPMRYSTDVPAPCFTDVWRELPEWAVIQKEDGTNCCWTECESNIIRNPNPTDALIDLLIWVRKEIKP